MARRTLLTSAARNGNDGGDSGLDQETGPLEGLTCIHQRIHCVATPETPEPENELDQIAIDNFLQTLAEVALAVARRRQQQVDP